MNRLSPIFILLMFTVLNFSCNKDAVPVEGPWVLKWSDEFDGKSIDASKWAHQVGNGTLYGEQAGWGNNEKQFYTSDLANSGIITDDDGNSVLFIEAINSPIEGYDYSSARLVTDSLFSFRFGKIEARIKLPYSQGIWPAFWTLGSNKPDIGWPGCGEIDILEMLGGAEDIIYGTVHYVNMDNEYNSIGDFNTHSSGKYSDDYHIYSFEWTPDNIKWYIDNSLFHQVAITDDMKEFLRPHYLIMNIAVGGYWPGYPDETTVFPQRMLVDYVRYYENSELLNIPAEPLLDMDEETMGLGSNSAQAAIKTDFSAFQDVAIVKYGPASPELSVSTVAYDGGTSILAVYKGGSWGGFWFELASETDMTAYQDGNLVVALNVPDQIAHFEVKLESTGGSGSVNLRDYPSEVLNSTFTKFTIPLSDFVDLGLDLSKLTIPFALWNPQDADEVYIGGNVLVDNLHFEL